MVRVGILSVAECGGVEFGDFKRLPISVRERIKKTANPEEKLLRIASYTLLLRMYENAFSAQEMPEIIYTPGGKPKFSGSDGCFFNISHSRGAVAVAISDREVGIDVEGCEVSAERAQRVEKRCAEALAAVSKNEKGELGVEFLQFDVRCGEIVSSDGKITVKDENPCGFSLRWTRLEAALKLDGDGFAGIKRIEKIASDSLFKTVVIEFCGRKIALTVAQKA